ncbi:hypothetical protein GGR56DRAFT_205680 [Xylariaceae sp. FL0804]|nr:hypothetical protein GGR56DRAFT_205680 [Xylariaceae sp. FL0804]
MDYLDASQGREVVYCHACERNWYRDERPDSLTCPSCQSQITEIISPENDPREIGHLSGRRPAPNADDDPQEEDIEAHLAGPGRFFSRQSIYNSHDRQHHPNRMRGNPDNGDDIIRRFTEMLGDMGGPSPFGRAGGPAPYRAQPQRITYGRVYGPGVAGGMSSFTIATGSGIRTSVGPVGGPMGHEDPFQRIFSDIFRDVGSPLQRDGQPPPNPMQGNRGARGPGPDLATALNQILASVLNPNAIHGDAVYSQEALDRIITGLMEANPQSNAPAPASEESIRKLPKKKLNEEMLGPELKAECSICIDDMTVGDEAVVLPCKHWFHEECVSLWLKEHNSCPICRAPIDGEAAGQASAAAAPEPARPGPSTASTSSSAPRNGAAERRRSNIRNRGEARLETIRDAANPYLRRQSSRRDSNSPPMHHASAQYSPRMRSTSPSNRRPSQSDRSRDGRGSSSSGPFNWLRDQFTRDRRT